MKYICPKCTQEYDIQKYGKYKCIVCDSEFEIQEPEPVKNLSPEPIHKLESNPIQDQKNICPFCKLEIPAGAQKCGHCGEWISGKTPVNRTIYILLSFLFGHFGVHEFYAGNTFTGIIYLLITSVSLVAVGISGHPAGMVIAGSVGIFQFIMALLSDVGNPPNPAAQKEPITKGTKILWWCIYIVIFLLIISAFLIGYISEHMDH